MTSRIIKPLSKREQAWIDRAQRVFDAAPGRLAFMTSGDRILYVLDRDGARGSDLCDGAAARDGVVLGTITTKEPVHGVSA